MLPSILFSWTSISGLALAGSFSDRANDPVHLQDMIFLPLQFVSNSLYQEFPILDAKSKTAVTRHGPK